MHNYFILTFQSLGYFLFELIYFPFWWYTYGLLWFGKKLLNFMYEVENLFALKLWIKNIINPLFAKHTAFLYIASFFIRLFQILIRGSIFLILALLCISLLIAWIFLPIIVVNNIFIQLYG